MVKNLTLCATLALALVTPVTGAAQDSTAAADSLRQRLEDLESAVRLLQEQLAAESEAAVRTRSRLTLELHGRVLVHGLYTSAATNNADLPLFVSPAVTNERPGGGTMTIRQSTFGLAVRASDILGARFDGDLDVDFFGGQQPSSGGRHFPLLRLRTARAALRWERWTLMAGQDQPLITDLDPLSLATVGTPGFANAGNLWLWLPQVRAGFESRGALRLAVHGAVLAPVVAGAAGTFNTGFDAAERSRWPSLQARVGARWGTEERRGELGLGVHHGRVRTQADTVTRESRALAVTALVPLPGALELRGEWYDGQLVAGLGGGGIGQSLTDDGRALGSQGGWAQLNLRPSERWLVGIGVGSDLVDRGDVPVLTDRRGNLVQALHAQWTPSGPLVLGLEWRRLATEYAAVTRRADHLNLAVGFQF